MTMAKTTAGHQVLKDRSAGLSARQRTALILFDGRRSVEEVSSSAGATQADIERLVQMGLIADQRALDSEPPPLSVSVASGPVSGERYLRAYKVAIDLTAELGPRGSHLLLAVEAADNLEELAALAPRLRAALLPLKFAKFEAALHGR